MNIADGLLKIETCKLSESLIFENVDDENNYLQSEEGKKVSDESFVKKLEETEEIIISKQ
jgi:hypothetical protein